MKKQDWNSFSNTEGLVTFKMVLNSLCFMLLLLTVFLPYWLKIQVSHTNLYMGLWKACGDKMCEDILNSVLIKVVQVLMGIAIVTGFLAFMDIFLILINVVNDTTFYYLSSALCSFVTALLGLVAQIIFMISIQVISIHSTNHLIFEWGFYLGWGTSTLYLLSGSLILVRRYMKTVKSRTSPMTKSIQEPKSTSS
uniref:Protein NKG7-like n=1 Tax=Phascolarctos cinereus TaxID=38626 RepID=A0A6P5LLJ2_PHACI|nr:protein NKG7-like [Phascolarctos cinereus]